LLLNVSSPLIYGLFPLVIAQRYYKLFGVALRAVSFLRLRLGLSFGSMPCWISWSNFLVHALPSLALCLARLSLAGLSCSFFFFAIVIPPFCRNYIYLFQSLF